MGVKREASKSPSWENKKIPPHQYGRRLGAALQVMCCAEFMCFLFFNLKTIF
jgi:hypothetical protein